MNNGPQCENRCDLHKTYDITLHVFQKSIWNITAIIIVVAVVAIIVMAMMVIANIIVVIVVSSPNQKS